MYMELTPSDTLRDLQNLLIEALPGFEFPRKNLMSYEFNVVKIAEEELLPDDFVLGTTWGEMEAPDATVIVDRSNFTAELTEEEINIIAILMMCAWVQRQVTSIENTRMKFSGSDFKFTSQANHLSKLLNLLSECQRQSHHLQRLYKRRRLNKDGVYESNWDVLKLSRFDY